MADFRVYMVRPTCKDYASLTICLHFLYPAFTLVFYVVLGLYLFVPCFQACFLYFVFTYPPLFSREIYKTLLDSLFIGERHKWSEVLNPVLLNVLYVVFDVFRIPYNHRTVVMVLRRLCFLSLVVNTRVEDCLYSIIYEPFHVAV